MGVICFILYLRTISGIRIRGNTAYIIDSVYGFYKVDLKTKVVTVLVKPSDVSPRLKFPNDVDVTNDERFAYFTDSSSIYPMKTVADIGLLDGESVMFLFQQQSSSTLRFSNLAVAIT